MINKFKNYLFFFTLLITITFSHNSQNAAEIFLYADDISYDNDNNIIARGKAKILYKNKIISSNLIIYSQNNDEVNLPIEFSLRDEQNNYYYGTSGFFKSNLNYGYMNDVKALLNDGSRIVGKTIKREQHIDIITKGVYSPCESKIKIANFLCPIWQLEAEKMLHDYDNLFLYQKHSKMRVFTFPVFYTPYLVTPSPLRKKRKSGFLTTSINLKFFDTKVSQSTSFPYYFNLSQDKELTFTPTIQYGGGIESSQRFNFDYDQILSGGNLKTDLTFDTTFENKNNEKWLKEGSIINSYNQNINEKFTINISSALQTSKNYIQQTNPNDELSYSSSLNSTLNLNGYNLNKIDDVLRLNITTYQSNQNNEDNKTIPTILPYVTYFSGADNFKNYKYSKYSNTYEFYNIFRDKPSEVHAKAQRKLSSTFAINTDFIKYSTRIKYRSNIYNQLFSIEDKKINSNYVGSNYFRSFLILGVDAETPFKFKNNYKNFTYTPNLSLVLTPGISNSEKLSNEDSSINSYSIGNNSNLNRYTGTDKLDNSKRINLSFNMKNDNFDGTFWQSYEFTNNSNYHYSQGNEKKLSDLLGAFSLKYNNFINSYNFRFDSNNNYMKSQNYELSYNNVYGDYKLSYLDEKSKTNEIIVTDSETLKYRYDSKKIFKYSKISYFGLYNLKESMNKESGFAYSYFDECFGVNIDFKRNSYTEGTLKPQDIMTVMFSFKNIGSYKSTNLAVSETDKQDIRWESNNGNDDLFN